MADAPPRLADGAGPPDPGDPYYVFSDFSFPVAIRTDEVPAYMNGMLIVLIPAALLALTYLLLN